MPGMLAAYICGAILCLASSMLGRAICILCSIDRWTWTAPAVGFAGLLTIVDASIRLPGGGWTSLALVIVSLTLSLMIIVRRGLGIGLGSLLSTAVPVVIVVGVLASGGFLINENFGIPGVSVLNDFAGHLPWAEALSTRNTPFKLIIPGYPIGGFALAGTLWRLPGVSLLAGFQGILIATPVLIATTTVALFERLGGVLRVMAATVVSLAYLVTSALVEGAFKEPIEVLFLLAIAISLWEVTQIEGRRSARVAVPIAVLMAGSVANYSYPGLSWPGLLVASWLVLELVRRRHAISRSLVRRFSAAAGLAAATLIVLALPEIVRFRAFAQAQVATIDVQTGNVPTRLPWRETMGIWFSDDFRRWQMQSLDFQHALLVFAVAVLAFGVVQAWRRRETSLLALLVAGIAVALYTRDTATAYNSAKAMMVLSCAVVLVMVRGLLPTGTPGFKGGPVRGAIPRLELTGTLLAVALAAACLWSAGLALRGSEVGPSTHIDELSHVDSMLAGRRVLFLGQDDFAAWELRHTHLGYLTTYDIPSLPISFRPGDPFVPGGVADFDNFTSQTLDSYSYVVVPRSAFASTPPLNWHLLASTRSYEVWERRGLTKPHAILPGGVGPGAILNCSTPSGRTLSHSRGSAVVRVPPVLLDGGAWQGGATARYPGVTALEAGAAVTQQVTLPPGRWQVSLQYTSSTPLAVRARGLSSTLPAVLEHQGPYWSVGDIESTGGPVTVQVAAHAPPPLATRRYASLGSLAMTRVDVGPKIVPLRAACGRYVDWYSGR
jgi:hypothetical protein